MTKTFQEARPTPVSVIGWAWIIIGAAMISSAGMGLLASTSMPTPSEGETSPVPFAWIWDHFAALATVQIGVGALGIVAGKSLLGLRAWARTVAEALSWLLGAMLLMIAIAIPMQISSTMGGEGPIVMFVIMSVFPAVLYGVPVGLMIHHLRSAKVREACSG